jgi:hypothetical protein
VCVCVCWKGGGETITDKQITSRETRGNKHTPNAERMKLHLKRKQGNRADNSFHSQQKCQKRINSKEGGNHTKSVPVYYLDKRIQHLAGGST